MVKPDMEASKKPSRELLRLASFGTNKGSRRLAKELVYPCEFKHIKGLFLFQSLLLTDPGLLEATFIIPGACKPNQFC